MKTLSVFCLLMLLVVVPAYSQEPAPYPAPPANLSDVSMVAPPGEPGERLVITGTVFKSDGKTPYAGVTLYLYQADDDGRYNKTDDSYLSPRLHGWVKTNGNGKYKINTIKPGTYPRGGTPAHIHVTVHLPGKQPAWLDSFLFDGDRFLKDEDYKQYANKGAFSPIVKTWREPDGLLRAERNFILQ